jgi:hypothetical protein
MARPTLRRYLATAGVLASACLMTMWSAAPALASGNGSLYQRLEISWSGDNWRGHDRASFQIPGIGSGDVMCGPNTTWIQMFPSDRDAENEMWNVKWETKNGLLQTAVKDARVYQFSTPTSTIPHGTGASAYEGFNQRTPIEAADAGSMVGLISKRRALNVPGGVGVAPTSIELDWSWSGFHTRTAECHVLARFVTEISGPSRIVAEGASAPLPSLIGPVGSFNLNWHGENEYPVSLTRHSSLTVPGIGTVSGICEEGLGGEAYLTLTPVLGLTPFASVTTYQGEGLFNSLTDDYYDDPVSGVVGPITLPSNGFVIADVEPVWDAPSGQETELLVSSIMVTNNPDPASDYCEVSVEAITAPNPVL